MFDSWQPPPGSRRHIPFAKNERANVSDKAPQAFKLSAKELLNYPAPELADAIRAAKLIEIKVNDDG